MFENLTERMSAALRGLSGKARLTEDNIAGALTEVRNALIDGDVAFSVVDDFVTRVKQNRSAWQSHRLWTRVSSL